MTVSTKKMKQKQSHFMESFAGNISHDDGYTFENNTYKSWLGIFFAYFMVNFMQILPLFVTDFEAEEIVV